MESEPLPRIDSTTSHDLSTLSEDRPYTVTTTPPRSIQHPLDHPNNDDHNDNDDDEDNEEDDDEEMMLFGTSPCSPSTSPSILYPSSPPPLPQSKPPSELIHDLDCTALPPNPIPLTHNKNNHGPLWTPPSTTNTNDGSSRNGRGLFQLPQDALHSISTFLTPHDLHHWCQVNTDARQVGKEVGTRVRMHAFKCAMEVMTAWVSRFLIHFGFIKKKNSFW